MGLKEMFKAMDTDNSGSITFEELREGLRNYGSTMPEEQIRQLMEAVSTPTLPPLHPINTPNTPPPPRLFSPCLPMLLVSLRIWSSHACALPLLGRQPLGAPNLSVHALACAKPVLC